MQIRFDHVSADYQLGPIRAKNIIDNVSLKIEPATFTAVIGQTGAGKTSLLKLINGILSPSSGSIQVGEFTLDHSTNKATLNQVRRRIGMVFQFPENQLFAETVEADIAFGPENFNFTAAEVHQSVNQSLERVGLDQSLLKRSPFSLSGGQQRRVALAGVLATKPDILVLDEPGAGLDARGKHDIFSLIKKLNQQEHVTVLVVTHDMNDVAIYADHVLLLDQGKVITYQETRAFFSDQDQLTEWNLELPDTLHLQRQIEQRTGINFKQTSLTKTELIDQLIEEKLL